MIIRIRIEFECVDQMEVATAIAQFPTLAMDIAMKLGAL
jgi:hypothetical protein